MANIIKIYNVKNFCKGGENIPFFTSEQERQAFLNSQGFLKTFTDGRTSPFFESQNRIIISDSATSNAVPSANYLSVEYSDTHELRFYFVDNVATIQKKNQAGTISYILNLTEDVWQTHFFKNVGGDNLALPTITEGFIEVSTDFDLLNPASELPKYQKTIAKNGLLTQSERKNIPQLQKTGGEKFTVVATYQTANEGLLTVCSPFFYIESESDFKNLLTYKRRMQGATKIRYFTRQSPSDAWGPAQAEQSVTITRCFIVPSYFFDVDTMTDALKVFEIQIGLVWFDENFLFRIYGKSDVLITINEDSDSTNMNLLTNSFYLSTVSTRIPLHFKLEKKENSNNSMKGTAAVRFQTIVGEEGAGGIRIINIDEMDGTTHDITHDFEIPASYSPTAQYYAQHGISSAISTLKSVGYTAAAAFSGNVFPAAASAFDLLQNAVGLKESTNALGVTVSITGDFYSNANFTNGYGLTLLVLHNGNDDNLINRYGVNINKRFESALLLKKRYYRGYINNIYGYIGGDQVRYFIEEFKKGVKFI